MRLQFTRSRILASSAISALFILQGGRPDSHGDLVPLRLGFRLLMSACVFLIVLSAENRKRNWKLVFGFLIVVVLLNLLSLWHREK
jgi:hypothetical protein